MTDTATICYETGARIGDAMNIRSWTYAPDTRQVSYVIEKSQRIRVFTLPTSATIAESILTGARPAPRQLSYAAYTYLFKLANPRIQPRTGKEDCTYHFGRYYYIRQLSAAGMTVAEIAENIGNSSLATTSHYITREITDKRTGQVIAW